MGIISVEVKGEAMSGDEITQNEHTAREEKQINDRTLGTAPLKGVGWEQGEAGCVCACMCVHTLMCIKEIQSRKLKKC